ncbi:MAG: hypothetical protein QOH09_3371 [Pseudonocardiales bacterium]|jgi:hypothetical protein|nr:hypothetical protein [Pseudonocardiales bacterium]
MVLIAFGFARRDPANPLAGLDELDARWGWEVVLRFVELKVAVPTWSPVLWLFRRSARRTQELLTRTAVTTRHRPDTDEHEPPRRRHVAVVNTAAAEPSGRL